MRLYGIEEALTQNKIPFVTEEPMNRHTSFKIGGSAEIFACPETAEQLSALLKACKSCEIPFTVIGNGSNILVADSGINGLVISLSAFNGIKLSKTEIECGAGVTLAAACRAALEASLTGLEFAYGIPGSVGGAVYMNAGAYGGEMADVVKAAEYITLDGTFGNIDAEEMEFGYRHSAFKNGQMIITSVTLALKAGEKSQINNKMNELLQRRKDKQPLEYPSAGSAFKRPLGHFAGALIEKNGLKGLCIGRAAVSEKHAGFIVNLGGATAFDVKTLIKKIQKTVLEADGIMLEPEIIFIGTDGE